MSELNELQNVLLSIEEPTFTAEENEARKPTALQVLFPPLRFRDLQEYKPKPEENHILGLGWLRRGSWSLLTSGTSNGKSVAVEQIAACLACGKPVFGLTVSRPFRGLMLTNEQDEETLKRDFEAIAKHERLDPDLLNQNLQMHHAFSLHGPELVTALKAELESGGFDFVVLDNYQGFSADDINDSKAWRAFILPIIGLLKRHNAAMLLVDHTGKPADRRGWGANESVYLAAGTSLKANAARCSAELYSPAKGDERYKLHFGKNWERAGVVDSHNRAVRDVYLDRAPSMHEPYWTPSANQAEPLPAIEGEAEIVAYAKAHPGESLRKIAAATGKGKTTVDRVRARHPELKFSAEGEA